MKRFLILLCFTVYGVTTDEAPKHILEFIEGKSTVMNETEYIAVFCNYINNSGEICISCDEINVKAFQSSTDLKVVTYTCQKTEHAIQCDTSVPSDTIAKDV